MQYSYKVKIINPKKKSETILRHLPNLHSKFESVLVLRAKLVEYLGEQVPRTLTFEVGYYQGQQHSKISLYNDNDLDIMYKKCPGEITLWCEGSPGDESLKRKREDHSVGSSKRQKKEEEVDSIFQDLKEKHGAKYDTPRLRLWARMVANNLHEDLDKPPNIPAFMSTPQKSRSPALSTALSEAATAFAKAFEKQDGSRSACSDSSSSPSVGVSPGKAVDLRMKNYQQLRYIQQLHDDGILTELEYTEQKREILASLKRLCIIYYWLIYDVLFLH